MIISMSLMNFEKKTAHQPFQLHRKESLCEGLNATTTHKGRSSLPWETATGGHYEITNWPLPSQWPPAQEAETGAFPYLSLRSWRPNTQTCIAELPLLQGTKKKDVANANSSATKAPWLQTRPGEHGGIHKWGRADIVRRKKKKKS